MQTLTVGGGGREHAMMLAFAQAGSPPHQLSTAANAGMARLGENLGISEVSDIVSAALAHEVDFVAVGPEAPLINSLADRLRWRNIPVLGFGAKAARLEGSKTYAANFMKQYDILAPASFVAMNVHEAKGYLAGHDAETFVIKADGSANGKGVILPKDNHEAQQVVSSMMSGELFGEAGQQIVFQERLSGPEVSMFAVLDGKKATILFTAQDHKRLLNGDRGPNTGGMGAYSPVPASMVSDRQLAKMHEALHKTLDGMDDRGISTPGILYLNFMLAEQYDGDPVMIEYNARLGDPEAQVVLPLLGEAGVDVHELFYSAACGGLEGDRVDVIAQSGRAALTVCLAAQGYPVVYGSVELINGLNGDYKNVIEHHGATRYLKYKGGRTVTAGGRVLYVTGMGETVAVAARNAYAAIGTKAINFNGMQYRTDIGYQAI